MTDWAPMSAPPSHEDFEELRPHRWKTRLLIWLVVSVILHGIGAAVVWRSQTVRDWLFSSFREKPPLQEDVGQVGRSRFVFERLVRKRMIEASRRILDSSNVVLAKRDQEWKGVADRARTNPNFRAMYDAGLPKLQVSEDVGDASYDDILTLYVKARRLEEQVLGLYEQFKALNLSLMSVSGMRDGFPVPQSFEQSMALVKLERPERHELNRDLLTASDEALFAIKVRPATATAPEEPDGYQQWRAEATRAVELCEIMSNNCQRIFQNVEKPQLFVDAGFASNAAAGGGGPRWSDGNTQYVGESLRPSDAADSDLTSIDLNAVMTFGKHLGPVNTSRPAKYLVLDTWWEIGPFEYIGGVRNQASLDYKYPPENGVDLDATYLGKKDPKTGEQRKLKWEYHPMSHTQQTPRIVQRESLWYFYTEFWSDRDQEVWANIASDDYGVLWLNDAPNPVYKSGTTPRPWVVLDASQFVKLNVRKGTNRVLLKLDNLGGTVGFTVILCLR